ncbi:MAG: thioredoxin domain-containing protein [Terriglobales bacterium]
MFSHYAKKIVALTVVNVAPILMGQAGKSRAPQDSSVIAIIGGQSISQTELDSRLGDKLLRLRTEEYAVKRAILDEYIDEILLSREAAKQGISSSELLKRATTDRAPVTTDAEARVLILGAPGNYRGMSDDQAIKTAIAELRGRRIAKLRSDFMTSLRGHTQIDVLLAPPRATHTLSGGHSSGQGNAPVTVVEFSDFQCPFCSQLSLTLDRVRHQYGDQLQIIFKHFPMPMHLQAEKGAEAAWCAAEQNRFWPMHDVLFAESSLLAREQFDELANRAKLDLSAFKQCVSSHRASSALLKDKEDGKSLGVTGTPTIFINGQMVTGNRSYDELRAIVDKELRSAQMSKQLGTPAAD